MRRIAVTVAFCVLVLGALGEAASRRHTGTTGILPVARGQTGTTGVSPVAVPSSLTLTVGTPWRRPPLPASLSGITWAGGTNYYAVSDDAFTNEVGLYPMTLELASNGLSVVSCTISSPTNRIQLTKAYDLEAVVFDAANGTVWAADETRHTVKEYRLSDGAALRALSLPDDLRHTRSNLGIESLTLSTDGKTLWTCTEEALPCDGARSSPTNGTTVRLLKYIRPTAHDDFTLAGSFPYTTDAWCQPHDFRGKGRRGVSGLCALPDGSLLVLERELSFGGNSTLTALSTASLFFAVYHVDPTPGGTRSCASGTTPGGTRSCASGTTPGGTRSCASGIRKEKLASGGGSVFASGNYEGICLGPRLLDGKWNILLVSDSGDGASPPYILPMVLSYGASHR